MAIPKSLVGPGRPLLLNDAVEKKLVDATRAGAPILTAATYAGQSARSFSTWMMRGRNEEIRRADGLDPDHSEDQYLSLWEKVAQARAGAAVEAVLLIRKSAIGGAITEETTREYRDLSGQNIKEATVKRSAPDWRAAAWMLEKQHRLDYGKEATQVEVTGADGGPVQIAVDASNLASRVRANIAELTTAASMAALTTGLEADAPVDAEVVDGGEADPS